MTEIVVVDYKLCAFTYSFHAHQPFNNIFTKLSQLLIKHKVKPSKLIFAVDIGSSKRKLLYPEYKGHRADLVKKQSLGEQRRRQEFDAEYKKSIEWLPKLGTVIDLYGIEADDIGSIIAHRYANTDVQVTLVTSDKDWSSFLVADNIRVLSVARDKFITKDTCIEEYGVDPLGIFWMQCFAGSDKENVKGISLFGPKTFKKAYEAQEIKDFDRLAEDIWETYLSKNYRGMKLPEGVNYTEMYKLNYTLFKPVVFDDLEAEEQDEFIQKFHVSKRDTYDNIVLELLVEYNLNLNLSPEERSVYKV